MCRSIYGLKQAVHVWYFELLTVLKDSWISLNADTSLYIWPKRDVRIIMPVFTDDITIASLFSAESDQVVAQPAQHFLGVTSQLMGTVVLRAPNASMSLTQWIRTDLRIALLCRLL